MRFVLIGNHAPAWIARAAERGARAHAMCQRLGIAVEASYYTQGQYDFVTVIDAPDAETASAFSLWYAEQGFGRVQTMRAYTGGEVDALVARTAASGEPAVFRGYTQAELDAQYNARAAVPDFPAYAEKWAADSEALRRAGGATLDVAYGPSADETLDVFHARRPHAPVQIFFHGGYWRSMHKDAFSFVARPFVDAGALAIVVNYALCPAVDMDTLVAQCRRSIAWTHANAARLGGDPARIFVSGHSAGGHIIAMALATEWAAFGCPADVVKGAWGLSGLYDLEAIRLTFLNSDLRLSPEQARRNSPVLHVRRNPASLILSVGGLESAEFHRQTHDYAAAWRAAGNACDVLPAPGRNHYSALDAFADSGHALGRSALRQMGLA